ncbi:MAG: filamentous hemagglutinin family protein [Methylophilaceae bacterium]|jgi:filamentous hemagglutinin family protein
MKHHASLNRIYRLVWNQTLNIWVAVAESAKGQGKSASRSKVMVAATAAAAALSLALAPPALAAPIGGQVVAGQASISQAGNATTINQSTQNLAINWQDFSIAANEAVRFNQPNSSSIVLNRVIGQSNSQIFGAMSANGQVFILNPNGVLFGASSQVNVGGLVASTLSLSNDDFLAGKYNFANNGGAGSITNQGTLTAAQSGYIALLAPEVMNDGIISATLGKAVLAAGDQVTLNLSQDSLLGFNIDKGAFKALVDNKQLIEANGGQVFMSAKAADAITTAMVNNTGIIEASTMQMVNGTVQMVSGRIELMSDMQVGTVNVGGTLNTNSLNLGANNIAITNGASINLSSGTGNFTTQQGSGPLESYTVITAALDLQGMSVGTNYALGGNINLNYTPFTPVASFNSIFDGLGHIISEISITGAASTGLFANVSGATIQNVGLVNGSVTGAASTGALVGNMASTTINNSYAQNVIVNGNAGTGGLVGTIVGTGNSNINNSYTTGSVNGSGAGVGGLVGSLAGSGNISNSFTTGKVTNIGAATGGLVGSIAASVSITNSCASGDIQGDGAGTGGLVGSSAASGNISNSYATGNVMSVAAGTGGLVGSNTSGEIYQSFASGNVNGGGAGTGGLVGSNTLGLISQSFAVGNVSGTGWSLAAPAPTPQTVGASTGGFVGSNSGRILNSYSSGNVAGYAAGVGGLVGSGVGQGAVTTSYSSGNVTGTAGATSVGGGQVLAEDFGSAWTASSSPGKPILANINKTLTLSNTNFAKVFNGTAYSEPVSLSASCCVSMMTVSLPSLASYINAGVYSLIPALTLTNTALAPYFSVTPVTLTISQTSFDDAPPA